MVASKMKWIGLVLMGVAVLIVFVSGALAFGGIITTDETISIIRWCLLLGFAPGFIFHIFAVRHQWKEKQRK